MCSSATTLPLPYVPITYHTTPLDMKSRSITHHRNSEASTRAGVAAHVQPSRRRRRRGLQQLALPQARVSDYEHVYVAAYGHLVGAGHVLAHTAHERQQQARLDHLMPVQPGAQRVRQLAQLVARTLLWQPETANVGKEHVIAESQPYNYTRCLPPHSVA